MKPILLDSCQNEGDANSIVMRLLWGGAGGITLLRLCEVDPELFAAVRSEALAICGLMGQVLDENHPTVKYVGAQDPTWTPKQGAVHQWSLYNSRDNLEYNGDDNHWSEISRRFNSHLVYIPEFISQYFPGVDLQNCRLNALYSEGGLGAHREKIIGIPGREHQFKLRFHLPVVTNPGVRFLMDGQEHQMEAGHLYLFNQSCMHSVQNAGDALRVHLVWDCYLTHDLALDLIMPALS